MRDVFDVQNVKIEYRMLNTVKKKNLVFEMKEGELVLAIIWIK